MKPWNTWVAGLGCAGLCLALVGCGGSEIPDPDSDAHAATAALPPAPPPAPPAVVQNEPEPAPEPAPTPTPAPEPAPAPAPAPATTAPAAVAAESAAAAPKPEEPAANPESLAMNKPATDQPKAAASPEPAPSPDPAPNAEPTPAPSPATPETPPATTATEPNKGAESAQPNPAAPIPSAAEASNPFAVFSETQSTAPAAASATTPAGGPAEPAPTETPEVDNPPAESDRSEDSFDNSLSLALANRGKIKDYKNPIVGAQTFMDAVKSKDLAKIAEAIALRAPTEGSPRNQKLFQAILQQDLAQEDVDELAKKLEGYKYAFFNTPKSTARLGVVFRKSKGRTTILSRTITMRLEKAGWKVVDIGGEGEIKMPNMPRMRGGTGGGRR